MSITSPNKVMVPVDFSDQSFAAVDEALKIAQNAENIEAVYVLPELHPIEPSVVWQTVDEATRAKESRTAILKRLADPKYKGIRVAVLFGDPGSEITEHSKKAAADLIVLPSHGRTGLKRLFIGSVAERVVRLAHCPVLVLRD